MKVVHVHTFCCRKCLILHVVFLSFQQKEVRSWVISLDNVILLFICALLDRDCGLSCLTPALLHSSASSPALKSTLFGQASPPCTSESSRPCRTTAPPPHPLLALLLLRRESRSGEPDGEFIVHRFLGSSPEQVVEDREEQKLWACGA